jgi:gluconolactonase
VASMKALQCVALMAVLIQSFSVVDAGARKGENDRGVSMANAGEASEKTIVALKVDRLDAGIDTIVPANATIERVATGFTWVEGPVWIPAGYLMFAEITSNSIRKMMPDGKVDTKGLRLTGARSRARMA